MYNIALNANHIRRALPTSLQAAELLLFTEIDSTNAFLLQYPPSSSPIICCAEMQTHGKGRLGRTWVSSSRQDILLSLRLSIKTPLSTLWGITLVLGLATLHALSLCSIQETIQLKWPNDLYWQDKKLGGILVELLHTQNAIVIGIGLNVHSTFINTPKCSLFEITGQHFDRNLLIANILCSIDNYLASFFLHGFAYYLPLWKKVDYLFQKKVCVQGIEGYALGVTEKGELCIQDREGMVHKVSSGEIILAHVP